MSRFTAEIIKGRRASWSKDGCVTYSLHTLEPFTLDLFLQSMNKALNSSIPSRLHGQSLKQRTCSCSNAYSPLIPVLDESGRILMLETGQKAECVMVTAAQDRRYQNILASLLGSSHVIHLFLPVSGEDDKINITQTLVATHNHELAFSLDNAITMHTDQPQH